MTPKALREGRGSRGVGFTTRFARGGQNLVTSGRMGLIRWFSIICLAVSLPGVRKTGISLTKYVFATQLSLTFVNSVRNLCGKIRSNPFRRSPHFICSSSPSTPSVPPYPMPSSSSSAPSTSSQDYCALAPPLHLPNPPQQFPTPSCTDHAQAPSLEPHQPQPTAPHVSPPRNTQQREHFQSPHARAEYSSYNLFFNQVDIRSPILRMHNGIGPVCTGEANSPLHTLVIKPLATPLELPHLLEHEAKPI